MTHDEDIIKKAQRKLKNNVLKGGSWFVFWLVILSLILSIVVLEIIIYQYNIVSYEEYVAAHYESVYIEAIFGFTTLFINLIILPLSYIEIASKKRWRFWVLQNVHYLQDFIEIRKIAEAKSCIDVNEEWLSENYIQKKVEEKEQKAILEKLEVFEYAFHKDFEENLPPVLKYTISKKIIGYNIVGFLSGIIICIVLLSLSIKMLPSRISVSSDIIYYISLSVFSLIILFFALRLFRNIRILLFKITFLKTDSRGIIIRKGNKNNLIVWEYIHELEYVVKNKSDTVFKYLHIHFKEVYFEKFSKSYYKIAIKKFNRSAEVLFKEVECMYQKYLEK